MLKKIQIIAQTVPNRNVFIIKIFFLKKKKNKKNSDFPKLRHHSQNTTINQAFVLFNCITTRKDCVDKNHRKKIKKHFFILGKLVRSEGCHFLFEDGWESWGKLRVV